MATGDPTSAGDWTPRVVADGWLSWLGSAEDPDAWQPLTQVLAATVGDRWARRLLARGALRGLVLFIVSCRRDAVVLIRQDRGWRTVLLLRALLGRRRKLVALQFLDHAPDTLGERIWQRVDRWAIRRALLVAQVMSSVELLAYPATLGVPAPRLRLIRFPARIAPRGTAAPASRSHGPVLAAGRAHCDWPTLFAAAAGQAWELEVVCTGADQAEVEALGRRHGVDARVRVDVAETVARDLLAHARVSIVCVHDGLVGRGHVRLSHAKDLGTAIVATDIAGFDGYVRDGEDALLVAPGDPLDLRRAVNRLLHDDALCARLVAEAFASAESWTGPDYLRAVQRLAAGACRQERLGIAAAGAAADPPSR